MEIEVLGLAIGQLADVLELGSHKLNRVLVLGNLDEK